MTTVQCDRDSDCPLLNDSELFYDCAADALLMEGETSEQWRASCEEVRVRLRRFAECLDDNLDPSFAAQQLADLLLHNLRSYKNE